MKRPVLCDTCGQPLERLSAAGVEVARDERDVVTGVTLVHAHEARMGGRTAIYPATAFVDPRADHVVRLRDQARVAEGASLRRLLCRVARLVDSDTGPADGGNCRVSGGPK